MLEYADFKGKTVVFCGENASTGEPHPITGNMSFWGYYKAFSDRSKAIKFRDYYDSNNPQGKSDIGTAKTMRKYSLGCSVQNYLEDLEYNNN